MVRMHLPARLKSSNNVHGNGDGDTPKNNSAKSPGSAQGSHGYGQLFLTINAVKGRDLAAKDKGGSSDPFLVFTLGDTKHTTVTIPKTLNPEWNETIEMPISGSHCLLLEVACWDKDRLGREYMGEFDIPLEEMFANGTTALEPTWYRLESRKSGKKNSVVKGEVLIGFSLYDPINASATPQQLLQKLAGILALNEAPENADEPSVSRVSSMDPDVDTENDEDIAKVDQETSDSNPSETPEKRKRRNKLARLRRAAKQRAYEFSGMSDVAGVLFLEVSKITDLPPERNMTRTSFDMDAFVVMSLGKKTYKTRIVNHNLNPVYDEKLVFQVLNHETAYSLAFSVVDRDKLSGNDFIGTCNLPLEKVMASSPEPDPETGLYPLRDPEPFGSPMTDTKKSRFRLPLSRTTSSQSLQRVNTRPNYLHQSPSQSSLGVRTPGNEAPPAIPPTPPVGGEGGAPTSNPFEGTAPLAATTTHEDADLNAFALPITLKNGERWEDKHKPTLYVKAKYLPYKALRQQFWRAMLKQYDADDSGTMNKVELTTMLDSLGSTLHESTINGLFARFEEENGAADQILTYDQAVICLEDQLQMTERKGQDQGKPQSRNAQTSHPKPDVSVSATFEKNILGAESAAISPEAIPGSDDSSEKKLEDGENADTIDLADENGEERVVEIRECPICHQPRLGKRSDADIITHIATCASQDWRQVNNIVMAGFVTSSQAQRKWYSKVVTKIGYGGYKLGANSANILVQDRMTGQIMEERMSVYVRLGIRLLYKGLKSREMEKKRIRKLLRSMSYKQGRKYDDPNSVIEISSFISFHQLDMSEVLRPIEQFKNFNEFFYRELKPDARPCSAPDRPEIVTSPADCRTVVFDKLDEAQTIWVKGREFSLERLFGNAYPELAKSYVGGALGIFRLAPQDYHRFHIPVDGVLGEPKPIEGEYYTVNPMAIRSALDVYGENIRVLVPIDSEKHGKVMVVCVGAMMVGSTVITRKAGDKVARAEELGYFKFGGSTLLLLFQPGMIKFDSDLRDNSTGALETLVRVGMSVGHSPNFKPHRDDMRKDPQNVTESEKYEARRRIAGSLAADANDVPPPSFGLQ